MRFAALSLIALPLLACTPTPAVQILPKEPVPQTVDPLGPKPALGTPRSFVAPKPVVYKTATGMTVWLLERPALPIISMSISIPTGAADDPPTQGGLASFAANMMDEGAGDYGAIEISDLVSELGADLSIGVGYDGSRASLTVLRRHRDKAFKVFADVVARPRFEPSEFERVHKLWMGGLERRKDDAGSVARVVRSAVLYGAGTPYGHPTSGSLVSAPKVDVRSVKRFHRRAWRPDQAHMIVAGAITKAEVDAMIATNFADWVNPTEPALPRIEKPTPLSKRPRLVLVDRPDAPQAVITLIGGGIAADSPDGAPLSLVNTALGGSFTSRLNQNLREDHGWTYGASSGFVERRGIGPFIVRSSVFTNVTAPALREMLGEIDKMAKDGLSQEEFSKVRARDLTEMIETNETLGSLVGRLASLSALGLGYNADSVASERRQRATLAELNGFAAQYLDTSKLSIIIVGPKPQVLPQLLALELGDPIEYAPDGKPVAN